MYVFDTNSLEALFAIPKKIFPSMWDAYDTLVSDGKIISVKEAAKEIERKDGLLAEWTKNHKKVFVSPEAEEALFVGEIFKVRNFQNSLEQKKQLKGGPHADPFLIAKAKILNCTVVTEEKWKPNAAKIPNICKHFKIDCINLEGFMEKEGWKF
jgi:hypothetical protein